MIPDLQYLLLPAQISPEDVASLLRVRAVDAAVVVVISIILGYTVERLLLRIGCRLGVDDFAEGTSFERSMQSLGMGTVEVIARSVAWFIYFGGVVTAIEILRLQSLLTDVLLPISVLIPRLFVAILILVVGAVVGDKAETLVTEKLEDVKLPEVSFIPSYVKYTVFFVASLMALSQIGVSTTALYILLASYLFGVILFVAVATRSLLRSAASGIYLLLTQPYQIGDTVHVGEIEGVVQEIDTFTTRIDDGENEYVIPNYKVFEEGVAREID